jgi:polysaccharide pyruvyl transferase WcaK-like protein
MRKLAVLGWYGHGNFGDELILEGLRELFTGWQVIVYANDFSSAYPFLDFDAVNKCDLFVLGGGELISPKNLFLPSAGLFRFKPHSVLWRLYAHTRFAFPPWVYRIKIPKVILGCGVNGNYVEQKVVRELEQFSYIGVRDNEATKILKPHLTLRSKVHLFYDLAFALNINEETCKFLAKVFPFKLHGLILARMAGVDYAGKFYHPKVGRVYDTIKNLTAQQIRTTQKARFTELMANLPV